MEKNNDTDRINLLLLGSGARSAHSSRRSDRVGHGDDNDLISIVADVAVQGCNLIGGALRGLSTGLGFLSTPRPKPLNPLETALLDYQRFRDRQAAEVESWRNQIDQLQHDFNGAVSEICNAATKGTLTEQQRLESRRIMRSDADVRGRLGFKINIQLGAISSLLRTYPELSETKVPTISSINAARAARVEHHNRIAQSYARAFEQYNESISQLQQCKEPQTSSHSLR